MQRWARELGEQRLIDHPTAGWTVTELGRYIWELANKKVELGWAAIAAILQHFNVEMSDGKKQSKQMEEETGEG